eukprot:TRINITY_DN4128_c0_g2_i2.p1 TRINITY_DN4128_c0_g2~~TRINITY_DN4128_c0_g2_i2.p1  ORF type:complete len:110 (-),score=6.49 TRINITY_DN4128_c0_g2_i2:154-483(-)
MPSRACVLAFGGGRQCSADDDSSSGLEYMTNIISPIRGFIMVCAADVPQQLPGGGCGGVLASVFLSVCVRALCVLCVCVCVCAGTGRKAADEDHTDKLRVHDVKRCVLS